MNAPGALPLYQQIAELLIRDIAAGRLIDGERLPPERDMAAELGIAVGTLRKALKIPDGKGAAGPGAGIGQLHPCQAGCRVGLRAVPAGAAGRRGPAHRARSCRWTVAQGPSACPRSAPMPKATASAACGSCPGQVAAVEEIWLDAAHAERLTAADLSESLYLYYRQRLGLWIARAEDSIGQRPVARLGSAEFPHAPGALLPLITRVSWAQAATVCRSLVHLV